MDLLKEIRVVPDFPKKGINFFDITTVLQNPKAFKEVVDIMVKAVNTADCDVIACLESRGFLFASSVAYLTGKPLVPIRKKGKLPSDTISKTYALEYGEDTLEIHKDAVKKGDNVVIIDDLLATGGTVKASCELVEELGGRVSKILFLIELLGLGAEETLKNYNTESIIKTTE